MYQVLLLVWSVRSEEQLFRVFRAYFWQKTFGHVKVAVNTV